MSRKYVAPLLVIAALAVLAENLIFFRSDPVSWDETIDLDGGDAGAGVSEALAPLGVEALSNFLTSLAAQGGERSPFLTRLEADSLRPQFAGSLQTSGQPLPPRLDGILWSDNNRVAWLDGKPSNEGDVVRGHRIERIAPRTVTVRSGQALLELRLQRPAAQPDGSATRTQHETEVEEHGE